jgi:putative dehydrogenase
MSFAARLGLPVALTREILLKSSARSGMLLTRGKNMIEGKLKPDSTVDIWLKDLNIVTDEAELLQVPVWYSSYVLQANVLASSFGWGLDDDSRCVSNGTVLAQQATSSHQSTFSLTRLWGQAGIQVAQS